jgi:hypothetical protein
MGPFPDLQLSKRANRDASLTYEEMTGNVRIPDADTCVPEVPVPPVLAKCSSHARIKYVRVSSNMLTIPQAGMTHSSAAKVCIHNSHGHHTHHGHNQAKHLKQLQGIDYQLCSSVDTRMPARNPVPLDLASIPKHARYIYKLPLHKSTLSSHNSAGYKGRPLDSTGSRSFVVQLMQEIHRWPALAPIALHGEAQKGSH